jgi:sarcosine oxidase, subunit delta
MLLIPCPWCGPRDESEFSARGSVTPRPDLTVVDDLAWTDYLYCEDNVRGWLREYWVHSFGCRQLFTVQRHTVTNQITADETGRAHG